LYIQCIIWFLCVIVNTFLSEYFYNLSCINQIIINIFLCYENCTLITFQITKLLYIFSLKTSNHGAVYKQKMKLCFAYPPKISIFFGNGVWTQGLRPLGRCSYCLSYSTSLKISILNGTLIYNIVQMFLSPYNVTTHMNSFMQKYWIHIHAYYKMYTYVYPVFVYLFVFQIGHHYVA
jgi:hypothetical protein